MLPTFYGSVSLREEKEELVGTSDGLEKWTQKELISEHSWPPVASVLTFLQRPLFTPRIGPCFSIHGIHGLVSLCVLV
jgi:hypothetical protein